MDVIQDGRRLGLDQRQDVGCCEECDELRVAPYNAENVMTGYSTSTFSRTTLLHVPSCRQFMFDTATVDSFAEEGIKGKISPLAGTRLLLLLRTQENSGRVTF
jgi:hypothetical protein